MYVKINIKEWEVIQTEIGVEENIEEINCLNIFMFDLKFATILSFDINRFI